MNEPELLGPPPLTKWQRRRLKNPNLLQRKREQNKEWRHRPENVVRRQKYYQDRKHILGPINRENGRKRRASMTPAEIEDERRGNREYKAKLRSNPETNANLRAIHKKWLVSHKGRKYLKENKVRFAGYTRAYRQRNPLVDPVERMIASFRARYCSIVRGMVNHKSRVLQLVGCTPDEFRAYIQTTFKKGMTFANYGREGWHVDHIRPLSMFDLSDPAELRRAFHYSNCKASWQKENLSKNNRRADKPIGQLPLLPLIAA